MKRIEAAFAVDINGVTDDELSDVISKEMEALESVGIFLEEFNIVEDVSEEEKPVEKSKETEEVPKRRPPYTPSSIWKRIKEMEWKVAEYDAKWVVVNWSPLGEFLEIEIPKDAEYGVANFLREYATSFNVDEYVKERVHLRGYGAEGVPSVSIYELRDDAEAILKMYQELADAAEGK